jgi:hypothetical protein
MTREIIIMPTGIPWEWERRDRPVKAWNIKVKLRVYLRSFVNASGVNN